MQQVIEKKIQAMFWDMPSEIKQKAVQNLINDPVNAFNDKQILSRALNTFSWYELVHLTGGTCNLFLLLDDRIIGSLFPEGRRKYYRNAKQLLSKYIISVTR
jgi:hypothetical protein